MEDKCREAEGGGRKNEESSGSLASAREVLCREKDSHSKTDVS